MKDLDGRVAVVTGAASGIGRATARALAERGMKVMLADLEPESLARAESEFADAGHDVASLRTDVSVWDDVERLAATTVERFGAVHIVHNNAGVMLTGPVEAHSLADWEWVLGVNLWGVIHGVKAFVPRIKQAGEGHIINTASTSGLHAQAMTAPYNVSKFGVVGLTETLARELAADGLPIGASVVCPGATNTQIFDSERHRPNGQAPAEEASRKGKAFRDYAQRFLSEKGLAPEAVAQMIVSAIRESRFWVVTHSQWLDAMRDRAEAMNKDGSLVDGATS